MGAAVSFGCPIGPFVRAEVENRAEALPGAAATIVCSNGTSWTGVYGEAALGSGRLIAAANRNAPADGGRRVRHCPDDSRAVSQFALEISDILTSRDGQKGGFGADVFLIAERDVIHLLRLHGEDHDFWV